ncbi:MAG: hypothetical protein ACRBN8_01220 [Nannocystales bacterium]
MGSTGGAEVEDPAACSWVHPLPLEFPDRSSLLRSDDLLVWYGWSVDEALLVIRGVDAVTGVEVFNHTSSLDVPPRAGTVAGGRLFIPVGDQILAFDLTTHALSDSGYVHSPAGVSEPLSQVVYRALTTLDSGDIIAVMQSSGEFGGSQLNWARYGDAPQPLWRHDVDNQYGATEAAWTNTLIADEGPFHIISGMYQAFGGFDGPYMPYPWGRRFDSTTGEPLDGLFGEFESSGENYAHIFSCMGFVEDNVLATITSLTPSVYALEYPDPPYLGILDLWSPEGDRLSTQQLPGGFCSFGRHPDVGSFIRVTSLSDDDANVSNVLRLHADGSTVQVVEDTIRRLGNVVVSPDSSIALLQWDPASICRVEVD